jgi:hypothetical protein
MDVFYFVAVTILEHLLISLSKGEEAMLVLLV